MHHSLLWLRETVVKVTLTAEDSEVTRDSDASTPLATVTAIMIVMKYA